MLDRTSHPATGMSQISKEMRDHAADAVATLHNLRQTLTADLESSLTSHAPVSFAPFSHRALAARNHGVRLIEDVARRAVHDVNLRRDVLITALRAERDEYSGDAALRAYARLSCHIAFRRGIALKKKADIKKHKARAIRAIEDGMEKFIRHRDFSLHSQQFLYFAT